MLAFSHCEVHAGLRRCNIVKTNIEQETKGIGSIFDIHDTEKILLVINIFLNPTCNTYLIKNRDTTLTGLEMEWLCRYRLGHGPPAGQNLVTCPFIIIVI